MKNGISFGYERNDYLMIKFFLNTKIADRCNR